MIRKVYKTLLSVIILICMVLSVSAPSALADKSNEISEIIRTLKYSQKIDDGSISSVYDGRKPESLDGRVKSSVNIFLGHWSDSLYQKGNTMASTHSNTSDTKVTYDISDLGADEVRIIAEAKSEELLRKVLHLYTIKDNTETEISYNVALLQEDRYSVYVYEITADIANNADSFAILGKESQGRLAAINAVEFYSNLNVDSIYESDEEILLLWGLGAIDGSLLTSERIDSEITRGEFAAAICALLGENSDFYKQHISNEYIDINSDEELSGCIDYLATAGYMDVLRDGSLRPNLPISFNDAFKTVLRVLGYGDISDSADILKMSEVRKLTRNTNAKSNFISVRGACQLLFNMLNSKQVSEINNIFEYSKNEYMVDVLGIYSDSGQITQTRYGSLSSADDLDDNEISVNGIRYRIKKNTYTSGENKYTINNDKLYSLLGYNVKLYYRIEKNRRIMISYNVDSSVNKPVNIDYESISRENCSKDHIKYWDGKVLKNVKLSVNKYIVNGERCETFTAEDIYADYHDSIILFDGNGDGYYETVLIYDYKKVVIDQILADGRFTVKNTDEVIDLNDKKYKTVNYVIDGLVGNADEIRSGQSADIAVSESGMFCSVFVSKKIASGQIQAIDKDENEITVNGKTYDFDKYYSDILTKNNFSDIILNDSGIFYINHMNKIIYYEKDFSSENYAYLIKFGRDSSSLDERVFVNFVDDNAKEKNVYMSDSFVLKYKGSKYRCKEYSDIDNPLNKYQNDWGKTAPNGLIKYKMNSSGEIYELSFPSHDEDSYGFYLSYADNSATMYGYIAGKTYSFANSKIFIVPNDITKIDQYSNNINLIGKDSKRSVELFDANDLNEAKVMICYIDNIYQNMYVDGSHSAIISNVSVTSDENGDDQMIINCFYNGSERSYKLSENLVLTGVYTDRIPSFDSLKKGSVIKFRLDSNNEICKLYIAYNPITDEFEKDTTNAEWSNFNAYVLRSNGRFMLTDSTTWPLVSISSAKVYIYDKTSREKVKIGTVTDIAPGDKVLSYNNYGSSRNIYIIR